MTLRPIQSGDASCTHWAGLPRPAPLWAGRPRPAPAAMAGGGAGPTLGGVLLRSLSILLLATLAAAEPLAPVETPEQHAARIQWWRDAKFGVFVCWGPCSLAEGEIGWSRNGPRPGLNPPHAGGGVPLEVYDNLYKQFNPTKFDPDAWARMIRDAGAKYIIFLVKHHDGFCLWDTALTDYKVTNAGYGRDVCRQIADACHANGVKLIWYYSPPDWHHPDYLTDHHERYIEYLHGQIRELLTRYGKVDGLWFDGLQGNAGTWDTPRLFKMIYELQPDIVVNNRAGVAGDYDTPEQEIGRYQIDRAWESCITMSTGWSYVGARAPVKPLKECLQILIRCAAGGGNLALDTGPLPDGTIDPRCVVNYQQMGEWLRRYGETIYATTGGPYMTADWGGATRQGDRIWLHILKWPGDKLELPALGRKIVSSRALTGGTAVVEQTDDTLAVSLPAADRDATDTIVELRVEGLAADIPTLSTLTRGALTVGRPCSASSTWSPDYDARKAFDGDPNTRWGGEPGSRSGWLEVDLGEVRTVGRVAILEAPWNRVQKFELQYLDGEQWKTFHEGTQIRDLDLSFPPVTARRFRLNVLAANEVPTIWEVVLYPPKP
ncbi:MAG: alpha-L-fucosidase [Armatimonadetes bacterium]|nr:alpha-L-fucosidase [Armatimonadota bacterium]